MMYVRGMQLDVNYAEELEQFEFQKTKIRGCKLQACSPFRNEKNPSFAVNLEKGIWIDSGAVGEHWRKGNFIQLLSYLREETWEDTEDYLIEKYNLILADAEALSLNVDLTLENPIPKVFTAEEIEPFMFRHCYLSNRGINEKVQKAFKVGYDKKNKAVMICWLNKYGQIINMKFRSIKDKRFWYHEQGQPIKQHIFGLNFIHKFGYEEVYAVESETDAMYLWSYGKPAIAFGGASITKIQKNLTLSSPIKRLIIATDNDSVGNRFKLTLVSEFSGLLDMKQIVIPSQYKDVNDIPNTELLGVVGSIRGIPFKVFGN